MSAFQDSVMKYKSIASPMPCLDFQTTFFRTASGAQGGAANGAVEGREKPSGPPSVRHTFLFKKVFVS